jgi:MscS family membrane protein
MSMSELTTLPRRLVVAFLLSGFIAAVLSLASPAAAQGLLAPLKAAMAKTAPPAPSSSAAGSVAPSTESATRAVEDEEDEPESPDSPRASMGNFVELTRAGDYKGASEYLDVPKQRDANRADLARQLMAVLDRYDWIDLDKISPRATGNLQDGLPSNYEEIGTVPSSGRAPEPVRLIRQAGKPVKWIFSRTTVQRINGWYGGLPDRWFLEHLPAAMLRSGPRGLLWWQWIALPLLLVASGILGVLSGWAGRKVVRPIVKRTPTTWDDALLERLGGPLALALGLGCAYLAVPLLALYEPAALFVRQVLRGGALFDFFWALSRIMDVGARMMVGAGWSRQRRGSLALMSLIARVGKVVVAALAVVAFLSELGYPVASVIAGLGVGGLAIALAAQKTVENLFGAFSIGADQPFREGDYIKVEDVQGTVETIGLRSTRIRTLDRTLVTMPNGKLADTRIESFSARDRIRFVGTVFLARSTTSAQTEQILASAERVMREHAKVWPDGVVSRLAEIRETAFVVELTCWFQTSDWNEFQLIRQEVLLSVMRSIEEAGAHSEAPAAPEQTSAPLKSAISH